MLIDMANTILTTKKPWVLLVFGLVAISAIVSFTSAFGIAGNPLNDYATQPGNMYVPASVTPAATGATVLNIAALLLLALNVIILYGLSQGHVWSWYLLMFSTSASVVTAVIGAVSGQPLGILTLVINVVMLAALLKKEVVQELNVELKVLPADGVW
jgi:hypothetical protein